jgi:hypothetical protein
MTLRLDYDGSAVPIACDADGAVAFNIDGDIHLEVAKVVLLVGQDVLRFVDKSVWRI